MDTGKLGEAIGKLLLKVKDLRRREREIEGRLSRLPLELEAVGRELAETKEKIKKLTAEALGEGEDASDG